MFVIGGDGASELLTIDTRNPNAPVMLTPNVSVGWENSIEQAASLVAFLTAIRDGSFDYVVGDEE
jgi:hypothetical protein